MPNYVCRRRGEREAGARLAWPSAPNQLTMPSTESQPTRATASWLLKPLRWLLTGLGFLCRVALIGWATLAIYYSNLPWAWLRLALAVAFMTFGIWALWRSPAPPALLALFGVFLGVPRSGVPHPPPPTP